MEREKVNIRHQFTLHLLILLKIVIPFVLQTLYCLDLDKGKAQFTE